MKILRLILGDQLNLRHSWFDKTDDDVTYIMMEMRQETDYVAHHIQKVVAFFLAMRAFAGALREKGHRVRYLALDDPENHQDLVKNLQESISEHNIGQFEYLLPDEYRLDEQLKAFCKDLDIPAHAADTEHFLTTRETLGEFFKKKKSYLMESFYRMMRRKYDILMDGDDPVTGRWNYDAENRKKLPRSHQPPDPKIFPRDVQEIVALIEKCGVKTIGQIDTGRFIWPVTRDEALALLEYFCSACLSNFGNFQDALSDRSWSMYHSRLSFSMNAKILSPLEVIRRVVREWEERQDTISLAQVEGFVRQILGWREYMRGVYWAHMPGYASMNYFDHERPLPDFFWTGKTKMACVGHAVRQSLEYAYAHHIQRLMVTGNFALLAGIAPDAIDAWYLGIYIDAIEWVEITNTRGMSQFADGGIVGTKPYVSSANYIHKMSDYCKDCYYDKSRRTGEKACPFNSFYWHFYARNRDKLEKNPRIGMAYRLWDKMDAGKQDNILHQAEKYLHQLDDL